MQHANPINEISNCFNCSRIQIGSIKLNNPILVFPRLQFNLNMVAKSTRLWGSLLAYINPYKGYNSQNEMSLNVLNCGIILIICFKIVKSDVLKKHIYISE